MLTNLSCGRFVFYWGIEEGIEVLAKPIFVRGVAPSMAGGPCRLLWKREALSVSLEAEGLE